MEWVKQQAFIYCVVEAGSPKPGGSIVGFHCTGLLTGLQTGVFLLYLHMVERKSPGVSPTSNIGINPS